jgi:predicted TIM-barrel fold metal-dependent hydrolase
MMGESIVDRAFRGDTFQDLHIVDMHCHLGPTSSYYNPAAEIEQMIEDADRLGVGRLCIAPHVALSCDHMLGNLQTYDAIRKFPDRILGYLCLNPYKLNEIDCEFDRYYALPQFIGVKIHPSSHQYPINGPRYEPIFEKVDRFGGILLTHTWESGGLCAAAQCEDVIRRYPNINFILAHSLGLREGVFKAIELVNKYENAYMDSSGFEFSDITIETIMKMVDHDKVFYGSDMPFHDMRGGISRILFADLNDAVKEKLLSRNFRKLIEKSPKRV